MDAIPDMAALSDAELKNLTEQKMAQERTVSDRRRELHARLDALRKEHMNRLKALGASLEIDPDQLSEAITRHAPGRPGAASWAGDPAVSLDMSTLTNADIKARIQGYAAEEEGLSFDRRMLHGHIEIFRAEINTRLAHRDGAPSEHLAAIDVDQLSEILAHRGPPRELASELEKLD